jgi:hypothetical protein
LPGRILAEADDGGCGKGPRERGGAAGRARRSRAWPRGGLGTLHAATRRGTILSPWDARPRLDGREQPEAEERADARHRVPQLPGGGVMVLGGGDAAAFAGTPPRLVLGEEGERDCQAFGHRGSSTALGDPVAVGCLGDCCAEGRQRVVPVRRVPVCQTCTACACQGQAAAQPSTGRAPRSGVHRGRREQATTHQPRHVLRVAVVVFRLPTVEGLPRAGRTEDNRETLVRPEVRQPGPGQPACGSQDERRAGGRDSLEPRFWGGGHVPVEPCVTGLLEDAQGQGAGMEIDAAGKGGLFGVALP